MFPVNTFCAYNPAVLESTTDTLAGLVIKRARFYCGKVELWTSESITRDGELLPSHNFDECGFWQSYPDVLTGFTSSIAQYGLSEGYAEAVNRYRPE